MKAMYSDSGRVVAMAAALALAIVGVWEGFLRDRGYRTNFVNQHDECRRRQWDAIDPDSVVVLGSSEVMAALDLTGLAAGTGRSAHSLARFGTPPDLALEALAKRDSFHGVAIVSFTPGYFRAGWPTSALAVGIPALTPREHSPSARMHTDLTFDLNHWFRFRSRTFVLSSIVDAMIDGAWRGDWQAMNDRLEWLIDYSDRAHARRDHAAINEQLGRIGPPLTAEEVDTAIARLQPAVQAIQRRGGTVVFVTLHVDAEVAAMTAVPRDAGWDRLCRGTGAQCIHAEDHAELRAWEPGDGIHLDVTQRGPFTQAFVRVLSLTGVLKRVDR